MKTYSSPITPARLAPGLRLSRSRPRDFVEWQALGRWGKLPAWERDVAGYLLRQAREVAGLTQKQLAETLGVSQQAVAQAERWNANPSVGFMRRWAEACGVSLEIGFTAPPPDPPGP
jgi:DNA-binding XRE family transcriptional regulator